MLGAIVGDIIGSVYEWNNVKTTEFELFPRGSRFTDDTVMTIAICEALMEHDNTRFSSERTARFMQKWGRKYPHAGYGGSFRKWLQTDKPEPYGSWANGSAMRVSGCGLIASDIDEVLEYAESSSAATHNHREGIKGAQAIAAAIFWAKNGMSKAFIKDYVTKKFGYEKAMGVYSLFENLSQSAGSFIFGYILTVGIKTGMTVYGLTIGIAGVIFALFILLTEKADKRKRSHTE